MNAGNGTYPSAPFTTTAAGTYRFVAVYSGDSNNASVTSPCNAANEAVVVAPASPALVTTASAPVTVGSPISDTATLSGGVAPTPAERGRRAVVRDRPDRDAVAEQLARGQDGATTLLLPVPARAYNATCYGRPGTDLVTRRLSTTREAGGMGQGVHR